MKAVKRVLKIFGRLRLVFVFVSSFALFITTKISATEKFNQIVNVFHHNGCVNNGANSSANGSVNNSLGSNFGNFANANKDAPKNTPKDANKNANKDISRALDYNLELGNLVFYFEKKPIVNFVPEREKNASENSASGIGAGGTNAGWTSASGTGMASKVFIFPYAQIKDDKLINKINGQVGHGYKLKIERVTSPVKGVKLTFIYDLGTVSLDYKFFDSINNFKGVVFNFYNKSLIDKLKYIDDRVLKTVYNSQNYKNSSKKKIVVVDLGHGGNDFGAIGKFGLNEKDLTLSLGCQVRDILKKKGFDVFLTRDCDKTVLLDERTSYANMLTGENVLTCANVLANVPVKNCDEKVVPNECVSCANMFSGENMLDLDSEKILLSIHANSSLNNLSCGLETFCLDNSLFEAGIFFYDFSDAGLVENCLCDRCKDSFLLASNLNQNVYNFIKQCGFDYKNRGVKKSVSQLLLGSHMPAALIEVGFLSNEQDANFLKSLDNQQIIAQGICSGVIEYFDRKVRQEK